MEILDGGGSVKIDEQEDNQIVFSISCPIWVYLEFHSHRIYYNSVDPDTRYKPIMDEDTTRGDIKSENKDMIIDKMVENELLLDLIKTNCNYLSELGLDKKIADSYLPQNTYINFKLCLSRIELLSLEYPEDSLLEFKKYIAEIKKLSKKFLSTN